jgi:hypothetical protein
MRQLIKYNWNNRLRLAKTIFNMAMLVLGMQVITVVYSLMFYIGV